jgi:hypothetical protein
MTDNNSLSWNHRPKLFNVPIVTKPSYPPQDRNFPINIVTATVTVNAHHSLITRLLPGRCSAVVVLGQLTVDATRKHCHRTFVLGERTFPRPPSR